MADNPITEKEVHDAANAMAAKGIMPSNASVRVALGNRGSESTLQKYVSGWKKDLLQAHAETSKTEEDYFHLVIEKGHLEDQIKVLEARLVEYDRVYKELKDSLLKDYMELNDAPVKGM